MSGRPESCIGGTGVGPVQGSHVDKQTNTSEKIISSTPLAGSNRGCELGLVNCYTTKIKVGKDRMTKRRIFRYTITVSNFMSNFCTRSYSGRETRGLILGGSYFGTSHPKSKFRMRSYNVDKDDSRSMFCTSNPKSLSSPGEVPTLGAGGVLRNPKTTPLPHLHIYSGSKYSILVRNSSCHFSALNHRRPP